MSETTSEDLKKLEQFRRIEQECYKSHKLSLSLTKEREINATLHEMLLKEQAASAEWRSKYQALLSHVKGPAIDDDTSPLGGE